MDKLKIVINKDERDRFPFQICWPKGSASVFTEKGFRVLFDKMKTALEKHDVST